MKLPRPLHRWNATPARAIELQIRLAPRIICHGSIPRLRLVAGADLAFSPDGNECVAGIVVWDVRAGAIVEQVTARAAARFPYVPGLLTFREAPAILAAVRKMKSQPDVFMFDGQGRAHPRRIGLASHLGLMLDRPSVGCAKSVLVGEFDEPGPNRGDTSKMLHRGECVGIALRTRDNVKPVYASIGHRVSLRAAVRVILACDNGFRVPEPTRLADQLVSRERIPKF
ncbi:MAG: endonuclease V [Planctomycetes bacterium]|nr:endonuclease V [Planctomycetota bacterium]MBI3833612.1 endonuclease V [Planctomycetota bacterium]